jgi:putative DNA methylase
MHSTKKKLIEVSLPLDAINKASAREKSIRHGHPSTLHLWWARRPLAAARAVIFAQMVDDPSSHPELFQTEEEQEKERQRLFRIIEDLVLWENTTNEEVLNKAREEIRKSCIPPVPPETEYLGDIWEFARNYNGYDRLGSFEAVGELYDKLKKKYFEAGQWIGTLDELRACLFFEHRRWRHMGEEPDDESLQGILQLYSTICHRWSEAEPEIPAFYDPFAGGGALPLEAQRLGLESYASDLNPVSILINRAMIEIPPKFANMPPVNPESRKQKNFNSEGWKGARGLAEDVHYYGQWMREEAEKRIGHLYPKVEITEEMAKERPDLEQYIGQELTVIAWLWARTVKSPNPAFSHVDVPLASTFMLSTKKGKEAYVEPIIEDDSYYFTIKTGKPADFDLTKRGTKGEKKKSGFNCLLSKVPIQFDYIRNEASSGRMSERLMAIVAEGTHERIYLPPLEDMEIIARKAKPTWLPNTETYGKCRVNVGLYGMTTWDKLFTNRQLISLTTFSDLVLEARKQVEQDALIVNSSEDNRSLDDNGIGAQAYADAVSVYLGLGVDRLADRSSTICGWDTGYTKIRNTFGRQALPMSWDYVEGNPFSDSTGNFSSLLKWIEKFLLTAPANRIGFSFQQDAQNQELGLSKIVSTDPPYYDNIGYADLSDFFYVWLRRSMKSVFPELFATMAVPKTEELVATPYRHGSKEAAESFFLDGMTKAMKRLAEQSHASFPVTIYYAFRQSETKKEGTASTGWETFLEAVIKAGFALTGTWPIRTELSNRMIGSGTNALASSVVLVCRKRDKTASIATRREFLNQLKAELPEALKHLQHSNIAPVDLAQAAIGPGMAVFTRYSKVIDAEGNAMTVREALAMINQILDEVLAEQEGDFDADSRWALSWFEQYGFAEGEYGVAETLSKAKNTSVSGMVEAGILASKAGKVRLLKPEELPENWDPAADDRLTVWEMVHHLIRVLEDCGEIAAAELVARLGSKADVARELAYRLYTQCERKKRAQEALAYNSLVQSWPEIVRLAKDEVKLPKGQTKLIEEE